MDDELIPYTGAVGEMNRPYGFLGKGIRLLDLSFATIGLHTKEPPLE